AGQLGAWTIGAAGGLCSVDQVGCSRAQKRSRQTEIAACQGMVKLERGAVRAVAQSFERSLCKCLAHQRFVVPGEFAAEPKTQRARYHYSSRYHRYGQLAVDERKTPRSAWGEPSSRLQGFLGTRVRF